MPNKQVTAPDNGTKLISFIVPFYNTPIDMLSQCIESILSLPLSPDEREIILIDDGSNPSPKKSIERFRHSVVYIRTLHQGVSEARNTGLQMANGQYIQFIDGDDYLISEGYSHCIALMRQRQADLVLFNHTCNNKTAHTPYREEEVESGCMYMLRHNIRGAVWGYAFRRDVLKTLRFTKGVRYGEDEEFTPQLILQAGKTIHTTATAYFYRQHSTSALHISNVQERLNENLNVILRLKQTCQTKKGIEAEALKRRVAQLTMDYLYNALTHLPSFPQIEKRVKALTEQGLFPLPYRNYTLKYKWFRRITLSRFGRKLLYALLPKNV